MAVDSYDPITGAPQFSDGGAPDIAVDPTEVAKYAAEVGNRIVRANLDALDAYPFKRAGLSGHALDTGADYIHDGSGWHLASSTRGGAFATARGFQYVNPAAGVTVPLPAGRFTVPPLVFATPWNASGVLVPLVTNITQASFFLRVYTLSGSASTANVSWRAEQATPTGLNG